VLELSYFVQKNIKSFVCTCHYTKKSLSYKYTFDSHYFIFYVILYGDFGYYIYYSLMSFGAMRSCLMYFANIALTKSSIYLTIVIASDIISSI